MNEIRREGQVLVMPSGLRVPAPAEIKKSQSTAPKGGGLPPQIVKENVRMFLIDRKTGEVRKMLETANTLMYAACDLLIRRLFGGDDYKISAMYMEFVNAAHVPVPAPPSINRDEGLSYYLGLGAHRDFLRVPLVISPYLQSTDSDHYTANSATLHAMSSGHTEGVLGREFSAAEQSTVHGLALVATPDQEDYTQDIVFCRAYLTAGIQVQVGHDVGLQHTIYSTWET